MPTKWLTEDKSLRLIKSAVYGRLATCGEDHQPYITPLNFVLIEKKIYLHCGFTGRKIDNLTGNSAVCFEVSRHGKLYSAPHARNFSMRYWSVLVFGAASQVTDREKKLAVMNQLMEKYASNYDYISLTLDDMTNCNLIEIQIEKITGKVSVDPK